MTALSKRCTRVETVHNLIREEYAFAASTKVLARHMYSRMHSGKIVIIADNPQALLSPLRKQWLKLARKVHVQRASTINGTRIKELTFILAKMQTMHFKAEWGDDLVGGDVYLATVDELLRWPPECRTMYITCFIKLEDLHKITAWMQPGSSVIIYQK